MRKKDPNCLARQKEYGCPCKDPCPVARAMSVIGGRWKIPILCVLHVNGPTRYNELKRKTHGISNTMLAKCLKELEEDGMVTRKEYLEIPVRVEYEVTERVQALSKIMDELVEWGESLDTEEKKKP
jgi:DNA-binding HxlR family transcriptional regulator